MSHGEGAGAHYLLFESVIFTPFLLQANGTVVVVSHKIDRLRPITAYLIIGSSTARKSEQKQQHGNGMEERFVVLLSKKAIIIGRNVHE